MLPVLFLSKVQLNLNPNYYPGEKFRLSVDDQDTYRSFNKVELNGKATQFMLKHEDLRKGGKLEFTNSK